MTQRAGGRRKETDEFGCEETFNVLVVKTSMDITELLSQFSEGEPLRRKMFFTKRNLLRQCHANQIIIILTLNGIKLFSNRWIDPEFFPGYFSSQSLSLVCGAAWCPGVRVCAQGLNINSSLSLMPRYPGIPGRYCYQPLVLCQPAEQRVGPKILHVERMCYQELASRPCHVEC